MLANADGPDGRRDSAMFHLIMHAGQRVGSVVALDVETVDLEPVWLVKARRAACAIAVTVTTGQGESRGSRLGCPGG